MKYIKLLLSLLFLVSLLMISLLMVMLNPVNVEVDLLGLFLVENGLGIILLITFVLGIIFALFLVFLPSSYLILRNKRLEKQKFLEAKV